MSVVANPTNTMRRFTHRDMQDLTMDYDVSRGDSNVRLRFGMQIFDDEGAKSESAAGQFC